MTLLLQALRYVSERDRAEGTPQLVIFTESRVTQNYLRDSLVASRMISDDEISSAAMMLLKTDSLFTVGPFVASRQR